jgi:AcrR family transcriptional regulator
MASGTRPRRPGRPPAHESRERAAEIVAAARVRFAEDGIAAAALSAIARDAGITLAALYHYFPNRNVLFEVVYRESLELIWTPWCEQAEALDPRSDFLTRMTQMLGERWVLADVNANFFTPAQIHVRRSPELSHLFEERTAARRHGFELLVGDLALEGRIRGVETTAEAVGLLEVLFSGWAFEGMLDRGRRQEHLDSALTIAAALTVEPGEK